MLKKISILFILCAVFVDCSKVPVTGRRQVNLLPESQMTQMSATAYSDFLSENPPLPQSDPKSKQVSGVGQKIAAAAEKYLRDNGNAKLVEDFDWQFYTVDDPTVNAWCMPGGRVVFYTGILPICQDETGLAVVMGHEIAHAVARHGNERLSQGLMIQGAGMTIDILSSEQPDLTRNLLLQSFGIGTSLGSLAFSRSHETEADKIGLIFMAIAGYDPRQAPLFWGRMAEMSGGGGKPPEWLSTHPSDESRVSDLEAYMPEALKYYKP
jgi:predicted Zn-dependent protease